MNSKKKHKKEYEDSKFSEKLERLEHSRLALEIEKNRLIRDEQELREKQEEEKYKQWAEHEINVIFEIKNICKNSDINFPVFDNTNLPIDFDFQVKPDCLVEFLDQYIIFDAKKSKNPQSYIDAQVKQTAKKYSASESKELFNKIYSTIFFVMPENEILQLKKTVFQDSGYTFVVLSLSALYSTLLLLKKISQYEKLTDFSLQDRENIIHLMASYDRHISYQNAVNFVLAKQSFEIKEVQNHLPEEFVLEMHSLQHKTNNKTLNQLEVQKYAKNQKMLKKEMGELLKPKSIVSIDVMKKSEKICEKNISKKVQQIKIEHV